MWLAYRSTRLAIRLVKLVPPGMATGYSDGRTAEYAAAQKGAAEHKNWLEEYGNLAEVD